MPALLKVSASVRPSHVFIFQCLSWGRDVLSLKVGLTANLGLDLQMWSPTGEWRRRRKLSFPLPSCSGIPTVSLFSGDLLPSGKNQRLGLG